MICNLHGWFVGFVVTFGLIYTVGKLGSSGDFKKDEKRLGFCECCGVHYKNLDVVSLSCVPL